MGETITFFFLTAGNRKTETIFAGTRKQGDRDIWDQFIHRGARGWNNSNSNLIFYFRFFVKQLLLDIFFKKRETKKLSRFLLVQYFLFLTEVTKRRNNENFNSIFVIYTCTLVLLVEETYMYHACISSHDTFTLKHVELSWIFFEI